MYVPENDEIYHSDHDSSSEMSAWEFEEAPLTASSNDDSQSSGQETSVTYYGKKRCFSWSSRALVPRNSRSASNIIKIRVSCLKGEARRLKNPSPEDIWRLFFTDNIIDDIVNYTNSKLYSVREKLEQPDSVSYKNTSKEEVSALFGLLILSGIFKSSKEDFSSLFSTRATGRPIFRATMSEKRCKVLVRALRFDDPTTRKEREKSDPLAAISSLFETFIQNCQRNYEVGSSVCIDETLIPFRGRCKFKMYIPNKPAKYGIKVLCLTDAKNSYLYNAYVYAGKESDGMGLSDEEKKQLSKPSQAVVRLSKCIYNTNRNVTCDNWFTSVEIAQRLWDNGLTIVGTMRRNKPQIPSEFQAHRSREVGSSLYGFTKEMTLLSFTPKKNKAVILLSTMHHDAFLDQESEKPEIISFYNSTKSGVDTLDMKCSNYSCNRRTRRWPLAIFYHLVSVSCCNAFVLHRHIMENKASSRFHFMETLGLSLITPHMKQRLQTNLPDTLRATITEILGIDEKKRQSDISPHTSKGPNKTDRLEKRKSCRYCPYQKKRMTNYQCVKCLTPTCLECSKKLCNTCVSEL